MQVERVRPGGIPAKARPKAGADGFGELLDTPAAAGGGDAEAAAAASAAGASQVAASEIGAIAGRAFESGRQAVVADREARRHGKAMLQALGALQLSVLSADEGVAGAALAALAARMPEADDPVLRLILREIGVRAAVELARHGAKANISIS